MVGLKISRTRDLGSELGSRREKMRMGFSQAYGVWVVFNLMAVFSGVSVEAQLEMESGYRAMHSVGLSGDRPAGVMWVVQLADLHLSKFYPDRAESLQKMMGTIIGTIQPSLVLITGDLTDAKNKAGTSTQQYEEEWVMYRDSVDIISKESGIPLNLFYDIRGNHDKYGVPYTNSSLDYYSQYSCNARQKRTSLVQSITLLDRSGFINLFVGVDDSMSVGLRGPSNLFGHPSDSVIEKLDRELSQWDNDSSEPVTKIVFGHFPMSFTAPSESGQWSVNTMIKHNISAFVCGHLHCKFGRELYRHHETEGVGEFWEWEMGDWRASRMIRILAIDQGRVSFVDVDFFQSSVDVLSGEQFVMPTIILPTSPLDSRFMLSSFSVPGQANAEAIRVLVFSTSQPTSVIAMVFDSVTQSFVDYVLVESVKLSLVSSTSSDGKSGPFFYEALWDNRNYSRLSPTRYWLQVRVLDNGVTTLSKMWPISVDGKRGPFSLNLLGYIAIGVDWSEMYPFIIWATIFVIFGGFLILPRLVYLYLEKKGAYDRWAVSVCDPSVSSKFIYFKLPAWAFLEGSRNRYLWSGEVLYFTFLLSFPWFWGRVLADDYPIGFMTIWGWIVWPSKDVVAHQSGLGWPDIMGIVLPYMGIVVLPLVLLISALCAEQASHEIALGDALNPEKLMKRRMDSTTANAGSELNSTLAVGKLLTGDSGGEEVRPLLGDQEGTSKTAEDNEPEIPSEVGEVGEVREQRTSWWVDRPIRKLYLFFSVALAFMHLKLCLFVGTSYGTQSVFLSPIYVWAVPALLVAAICLTSSIRPRISQHTD